MAPTMGLAVQSGKEDEEIIVEYHKGVKHLCDSGVTKVPRKYILPVLDRPHMAKGDDATTNIKLPVIDFAHLQASESRVDAIKSLSKACQEYGFFQLINHGIGREAMDSMREAGREFFELPFEERRKYMSKDMGSPVRYGTSFNQNTDGAFCWRDFLKLNCNPAPHDHLLPFWPSSPPHLRQTVVNYAKETKKLYIKLVEAIMESLEMVGNNCKGGEKEEEEEELKEEFEEGSQMIVVNCYPSCPEPEVTLGMPPHSDYGFLTLLLQDDVKGLQIQHHGTWLTVQPIPLSFVVNVGDHLEIYSNGKYKSVMHRVLVNASKSRISIASLHSLPFNTTIRPSSKLIDEEDNPRRYKDTHFSDFLEYITSHQHNGKNFLHSRKLTLTDSQLAISS